MKQNMRMALYWLVQGCQPGDSLLFHYSGHGSRQRNYNGDEVDGYDETLCPLDFETQGMLVDDEINATIVKLVDEKLPTSSPLIYEKLYVSEEFLTFSLCFYWCTGAPADSLRAM